MAGNVSRLFTGERAQDDAPPPGPHSELAEAAILGALLTNNKRFSLTETLRPEHFYFPVNGRIFGQIARRYLAGQTADAVSLQDWLQQDPDVEPGHASSLLANLITSMTSSDIRAYVDLVKDYWIRRKLIASAQDLISHGRDVTQSIKERAVQHSDQIDSFVIDDTDTADVTFDTALDSAVAVMEETKRRGTIGGLMVPRFPRLNKHLRFLPEQLTILGGQSGEGKSAIAWQIFISAAEEIRERNLRGTPMSVTGGLVGLSFEMSKESLATRALSAESGLSVEHLEVAVLSDEQITAVKQARERLRNLPLRLIAMGGLTPTQMRMRLRQAQRKLGGKLAMVLIDHVQLVEADDTHAKSGGAWATGKVADAILAMSKEFHTHVLALSQVDIKELAKRQDKRPLRSDLRWSANFAQNADYIVFVHRPENHIPQHKPTQEQFEPQETYDQRILDWENLREKWRGKAEIYGDKARNGASKWTVPMFFNGPTTEFTEDPSTYD